MSERQPVEGGIWSGPQAGPDYRSARISVGRLQGGHDSKERILITLYDDNLRLLAQVRMTSQDFGDAITGQGNTWCRAWVPDART